MSSLDPTITLEMADGVLDTRNGLAVVGGHVERCSITRTGDTLVISTDHTSGGNFAGSTP